MTGPARRVRIRASLTALLDRLGFETASLWVPAAVEAHWLLADRVGRVGPWHVMVDADLLERFPDGLAPSNASDVPGIGARLSSLGCRALAVIRIPGGGRVVLESGAPLSVRGGTPDRSVLMALADAARELTAPGPVAEPAVVTEPVAEDADPEEVALTLGMPRWSQRGRVAVLAFAREVAARGISDEDLSVLLAGAARIAATPDRGQRSVLGVLARSVGRDRLIEAVRLGGDTRLGACWLLLEEGSLPALRTVAGLGHDKREAVRLAAALATSLLSRPEAEGLD